MSEKIVQLNEEIIKWSKSNLSWRLTMGLPRAFSSKRKKAIHAAEASMLIAHVPTAWKAGRNIIRRT